MFFTPFAFVQQPTITPSVVITTVTGYYLGGQFTTYATATQPYFRMLDSTGSISSSFNIGAGFNNNVYNVATQSDGKILVSGDITSYSGSAINRIARLNTNGTLDTTFNPGAGPNSTVNTFCIQGDGKIVAGGSFTSYSGSGVTRIARINTNGTIDSGSSFNTGAGFNSTLLTCAVQSDQKLIIGGQFTTYSGSTKNYIVRLNTNGTADTGSSWNQGVGFGTQVNSVALQSDQKIVVGGNFSTYSGSVSNNNRIIRLNTDGTKDTTFNPGTTGFNNAVYSVLIQPDGKIVIGGFFTSYSGSTANYIIRTNSNGTIDSTFNTGVGFDSYVSNMDLQSDGKILVQGAFSNYSGSVALGIVRLNSNGTRDTTFGQNLSINNTTSNAGRPTLQLTNGSIILGGIYTGNRIGGVTFLDYNGNRTTQSAVDSYGLTLSNVWASVSQSDGKIVIGGAFSYYSGSSNNNILRINPNGTLDTSPSWNIGTGFNGTINSLAIQSDQKLLVGGVFSNYSGSVIQRLARLNTNGTLDTTFNVGTGPGNQVNSIKVQTDGKVVIGGTFTTYSGSGATRIARINTNGTIDTGSSWNSEPGFNSTVTSLAIQSDQKVVVVGAFTTYSGSTKNSIARLNTNGTSDTGSSWNSGTGFNSTTVNAVALQSDQKIVVGGAFTTYSGSAVTRIVRINTNGTIDSGSSFNTGAGFNSTVQSLVVEPNTDKIVVGGIFTSYSGSTANRIVRINTNGTRDTTFSPTGSGPNATVNTILPY